MRIGMFLPGASDGTSFYRGAGPYNKLAQTYGHTLIPVKGVNWNDYVGIDVAFFQRPHGIEAMHQVGLCKQLHIPVICDWDDVVWDSAVHPCNDCYQMYLDGEPALREMVKMADVLTVSTPNLAAMLPEHTAEVHVIPNAWDFGAFPMEQHDENRPCVLFRGSGWQAIDGEAMRDAIMHVSRVIPECAWFFIGHPPGFIYSLKKYARVPVMSSTGYLQTGRLAKPTVLLKPVLDDKFNRAKSNCSWLEGLYMGAITVGPGWEEWQVPGCRNYKDIKDLPAVLEHAVRYYNKSMVQEGQDWVKKNRSLAEWNKVRNEILIRLTQK